MIKQKSFHVSKKMAGRFARWLKSPLVLITCVLLLMSASAAALDVPKGGATKDVSSSGDRLVLTVTNKTGERAMDVYVCIYSTILENPPTVPNITGMDVSHDRYPDVDDDGDEKRDEDSSTKDTSADEPTTACRLMFSNSLDDGRSTMLYIDLDGNPPPGTEVKILFSAKRQDGTHYNMVSAAPLDGRNPAWVSIPRGTLSGNTSVINQTGSIMTSIFGRAPRGNPFSSAMLGEPYENSDVQVSGDYFKVDMKPQFPYKKQADIYFRLSSPAPDNRTSIMISDKMPEDWPRLRIVSPPVAISEGTIIGSVTSADGKPAANTYVSIGTIAGTVEKVKTDEDGEFKSTVPAEGFISLAVPVLTEIIKKKIVTADKLDFPEAPPEFTEPDKEFTVWGNYHEVEYFQEGYGEHYPVPEALTISKDGEDALTTIAVPPDVKPGLGEWIMTDADGYPHKFSANTFQVLQAKIDRNRLLSGQEAAVDYRFDFGQEMANQKIWIEPKIDGPIRMIDGKGPKRVRIDSTGEAAFRFHVQAQQVVPGKPIPFSISPNIHAPRRYLDLTTDAFEPGGISKARVREMTKQGWTPFKLNSDARLQVQFKDPQGGRYYRSGWVAKGTDFLLHPGYQEVLLTACGNPSPWRAFYRLWKMQNQ